MIVVLDTNVWISALVYAKRKGIPVQALERARTHDVIATCREIEAEIAEVLNDTFSWKPKKARDAVQRQLKRSIRVEIQGTVHACRDPDDDMILECAQRAHADLIVAGDKDLLVLGTFGGTRIVTPAEYVDRKA